VLLFILKMLKRLLSTRKFDGDTSEVIRKAAVAYTLKIGTAILSFSFNVALARLLGVEGTGLYILSLTVVTIVSVLSRVGLDNTFVRLTAASAVVQDWAALKGLYQHGMRLALAVSLSATVIIFSFSPWLARTLFNQPELGVVLRWMSLAIVAVALYTLYGQLLKGLKRIRDSMAVQSVFIQLFSLISLVVLVYYFKLGVLGAVWSYVLGAFISLTLGQFLWARATPYLRGITGYFDRQVMFKSSMPLFWVSALHLITLWSSTFSLGKWASAADVGVFGVANRTAALINFVLVSVNAIAAPKFAELYKAGNMRALRKTAQNSTNLMTLMAAPVFLVFVLAAPWVMSIFGKDFSNGATILIILSIGQFINVVTGSVGFLLNMTGHEKTMRNIFMVCAVVIVVMNVILIPHWGAMGAAMASASSLVLQNVLAMFFVRRHLHMWTFPRWAK
jgi:O-antigen/teichoic acid export membrane protein